MTPDRAAVVMKSKGSMAIYHLNVSTGSKATGQSAGAKSDYVQREGKYKEGKAEIAHVEHGNMPEWAQSNPSEYWRYADKYERENGRLFTQVEFALPVELSLDEQIALVHDFAQALTEEQNLPFTLAIHHGEYDHRGNKMDTPENPHCHLIISERINDNIDRAPEQWFRRANKKTPERGGAVKSEILKTRDWLCETRERWQEHANRALEKSGSRERIDHRTLEAQGITGRLPQIHRGASEQMHKRGIKTERYARSVLIAETNANLREMTHEKAKAEHEAEWASRKIAELQEARETERREAQAAEVEALLRSIKRDFEASSKTKLHAEYENYVRQYEQSKDELDDLPRRRDDLRGKLDAATERARESYAKYHELSGKFLGKLRFGKRIKAALAENKAQAKVMKDTEQRLNALPAQDELERRISSIDSVIRLAGSVLAKKEQAERRAATESLPAHEREAWQRIEQRINETAKRRNHDEISHQRAINGHFHDFMRSVNAHHRQHEKGRNKGIER